jgi:hypothetical protein
MPRSKLRTLLILLAVAVYVSVAAYYAKPAAEAASDYVIELGARAVYRGFCYATFE